jgi:hypothetical protein
MTIHRRELKWMNTSLVSKQEYAPSIQYLHNTYRYIITVYYNEVSSRPYIGPRGSYFGKLLELLPKGAKVDGYKPSFSARLRKLLSISPQYI